MAVVSTFLARRRPPAESALVRLIGGKRTRSARWELFRVRPEAAVSGPLADGVRGRLAVATQNNGGYDKNELPGYPDLNGTDFRGVRATLAFDIFVHRLKLGIGSMVAALNGIDALVFTAGIGENSAEVRAAACADLSFLGLAIDSAKNLSSPMESDIATSSSAVRVLVLAAQEDWAIARECWKLGGAPSPVFS